MFLFFLQSIESSLLTSSGSDSPHFGKGRPIRKFFLGFCTFAGSVLEGREGWKEMFY